MEVTSIERYLRQPYKIYGRVSTTVSYGFASAVATREPFDAERVAEAMVALDQDPLDLHCVFCGEPAASWDHLTGIVANGEFSGYGHVLGNLVPACSRCNSLKGNRPWRTFIDTHVMPDRRQIVAERLEAHENKHLGQIPDLNTIARSEVAEYSDVKAQIFDLMRRADVLAREIRSKTMAALWPEAPHEARARRREATAQALEGAYLDFYAAIFERVSLPDLRLPTIQNRSWQPFRSGRWGQFWVWLTASELRVIAYIATTLPVDKSSFNKEVFDRLRTDDEAIRRELRHSLDDDLVWDRLDGRQASWVGFVRARPDLTDDIDDSPDAIWAARCIDALVPAVEGRLRAIVPSVLERAKSTTGSADALDPPPG